MIIEEFNSINSDRSSGNGCDTNNDRRVEEIEEVERIAPENTANSGSANSSDDVNNSRNSDVKVEVDLCTRVRESNL